MGKITYKVENLRDSEIVGEYLPYPEGKYCRMCNAPQYVHDTLGMFQDISSKAVLGRLRLAIERLHIIRSYRVIQDGDSHRWPQWIHVDDIVDALNEFNPRPPRAAAQQELISMRKSIESLTATVQSHTALIESLLKMVENHNNSILCLEDKATDPSLS